MTLCSFLRLAWGSESPRCWDYFGRHPRSLDTQLLLFRHNYQSNFLKLKSKPISIEHNFQNIDILAKCCIAKQSL